MEYVDSLHLVSPKPSNFLVPDSLSKGRSKPLANSRSISHLSSCLINDTEYKNFGKKRVTENSYITCMKHMPSISFTHRGRVNDTRLPCNWYGKLAAFTESWLSLFAKQAGKGSGMCDSSDECTSTRHLSCIFCNF